MAVPTFDANSVNSTTAGSVIGGTLTIGGTGGILLAYLFNGGTAPPISSGSITYAGSNLSLLLSGTQGGDPFSGQLWYLLNPPSGTGTLHGTYNSNPSGGEYDTLLVSYLGVNQSSPFGGSQSVIGTSQAANGTIAFTALPSNAISVGMGAYDNNTGTIATGNYRGTAGNGAMVIGADATGGTLAWSDTNNFSNYVLLGAELQGTVSSQNKISGYKSLLGIGQ